MADYKKSLTDTWVRPFLPQMVAGFVGWIIAFYALQSNVTALGLRVTALETFGDESKPLIERFYQLEERDKILVSDVADIKQDIKKLDEMNDTLDRILNAVK